METAKLLEAGQSSSSELILEVTFIIKVVVTLDTWVATLENWTIVSIAC